MSQQQIAVFEAFSWLAADVRDDANAVFGSRIKDLAAGLRKCLQLVEISELDRQHARLDDPPQDGETASVPLLSEPDTSILLRLAIVAAEIINEDAEAFHMRAQEIASEKIKSVATQSSGGRHG